MGKRKGFASGMKGKDSWGKIKPERVKMTKIKIKDVKPVKIKTEKIKPAKEAKTGIHLNRAKKSSIMGILLRAFFVPIVLIIILGSVSYITASNTIKEKVEESSRNTISAVGMYGELLAGNVSSKALEMVVGENLSSYYEVYYKTDDIRAMQYWRDAKKDLIQMNASVQYIYSFHVIPEEGIFLTSASGGLGDNAWQEFMESEEGRYFQENPNQNTAWLGYHSYLDKQLSISQDKYAVAFYRKFSRGNTYLVLDIRTETVEEMLNQMDFGENSIKSLISQDGREVTRIQNGDKSVVMENEGTVFTDKDFYTASKSAEEAGSQYVDYNGEKYLYVYAPMGKTGMMLCGLIPQDNIVKEVRFIRNLSIVMIILASAIALLIGSRIAMGMGSAVKIMTNGMDKVAEGDLTQEFCINRRDEFSILARGMNDMLSSMRVLMTDMKKFGNKVKEMADGVAAKSEIINTSIREISEAVDEVASGAQKQAHEADISNDMMTGFAEKVDGVCAGADDMGNTVDKATEAVEQGRIIVDELNKKTETTVSITKVLVENINDVQECSSAIQGFIDTINSIAKQTNLLSLNASIEAARAGENGKGFAVVAEEIRKLADESMQAGKNIKKIVENILETTRRTTESAKEAEAIVFEQADALGATIQVFGEINQCVETLVSGLRDITDNMRLMSGDKEQVQDSMSHISVVTEQAAVAAGEITSTLDEQVKTVADLTKNVELLKQEADALDQSIGRFIV
ncbi:MAG TPA: hypothetical protein DCZ40_08825 [Lachnospiraceae bacterium]|nr:hypothetical protein [Lachnospiraceae bacterium]